MQNLPKIEQKKLIIGGVIAAIVVVGGIFGYSMSKNDKPVDTKSQKKRISLPDNVIDVSQRPFVTLTPVDTYNITMTVEETKDKPTDVDYHFEYQSGTLLQALDNTLALTSIPASTKLFLGSCSAGGACTYHKDVKGGTLRLVFQGGDQPYAVKSNWRFIDNTTAKEKSMASQDAKFQVTGDGLAKTGLVIIYNAPGFPGKPMGAVNSEVYVLSSATEIAGDLTVSIRANEEGALKLLGWDGKSWVELKGTVDGKTVTTKTKAMKAFVVVK